MKISWRFALVFAIAVFFAAHTVAQGESWRDLYKTSVQLGHQGRLPDALAQAEALHQRALGIYERDYMAMFAFL